MVLHLTVEEEVELCRMAGEAGRRVDELTREALDRYIAEEGRFQAAVRAGLEDARQGNFVPTSKVWARVERSLKG